MPIVSSSLPPTIDTSLEHLDCLTKLGWLSFDTTHMGDPDGYMMTPCCIHGYRAVYGPRPVLDWIPYTEEPLGSAAWHKSAGVASVEKRFVSEQKQGGEGSWVLVTGATQSGDEPPTDAYAKWWVTSQTDVSTVEEEIKGAANLGVLNPHTLSGGTGSARPGGGESNMDAYRYTGRDWLGLTTRYDESYSGQTRGALRRWTKEHKNASYAGDAAARAALGDRAAGGYTSKSRSPAGRTGGIPDPGLGELSGIPLLGDRAASSFWMLYGKRPFLGITACNDPRGEAQDRDDHKTHGAGSNWRGIGFEDSDLGKVISPGATSEGGFFPTVILFGGEIVGAQARANLDDGGNITSITLTDPGATVITNVNDELIDPPYVVVNLPQFYSGFSAHATVTDEPDEIEAAWPSLFKTKAEMQAELSDGYNDPLAQTFLVDQRSYPEGMFLHSVDLCFQNKPKFGSTKSVYVEIRPTINGFPDAQRYIASVMKVPNQVAVAAAVPSGDGVASYDDPEVQDDTLNTLMAVVPDFAYKEDGITLGDGITRFVFDYPIYLESGEEYAIVVRSNDSAYKLWISDARQDAIVDAASLEKFDDAGYASPKGTYAKNYGGSLFRSQNGRTWSQDQWQDMMFRLNKCVFGGSSTSPETGTVDFEAGKLIANDFDYDRVKLNLNSILIPSKTETSLSADILVQKKSGSSDVYVSSSGATGVGALWNENEEAKTHDFNERMIFYKDRDRGRASFKATFTLTTKNPDISPVIDTRHCQVIPIQNQIDAGGLKPKDIKITARGSGYAETTTYVVSGGGSTSDATIVITSTGGALDDTADAITISSAGAGFHTSKDPDDPIVLTQVGGPGSGAEFEVISEEGTDGGNSLVRYQTQSVTLARGMVGRGLKVFVTARQPYGSSIFVYFKSLAEDDSDDIDQKTWKLMEQVSPDKDVFDEQPSTFSTVGKMIEYEFGTEEVATYTTYDGKTYDDFKTFVIKIVCFADNPAQPPTIKDMRAIAVF